MTTTLGGGVVPSARWKMHLPLLSLSQEYTAVVEVVEVALLLVINLQRERERRAGPITSVDTIWGKRRLHNRDFSFKVHPHQRSTAVRTVDDKESHLQFHCRHLASGGPHFVPARLHGPAQASRRFRAAGRIVRRRVQCFGFRVHIRRHVAADARSFADQRWRRRRDNFLVEC